MFKRVTYAVLAASLLGGTTSAVAALATQVSSAPVIVANADRDRDNDGNKRDHKGDKGDKGDRGDKGDQRDHGKQPPTA
jgi:hypothetical protein